MNRRSAALAITVGVAAAMASRTLSPAQASEESAARIVDRINDKIADLLEKRAAGNLQRGQLVNELISAFKWALDIPAISQSVLGPAWKTASIQQRTSFNEVFIEYLAAKYSLHFPDIVGAKFEIVETSQLKRDNHYLVLVDATFGGRDKRQISWYVLRRNGRSRVVNIVVRQTNILSVERRVMRSLLQQRGGDLDRLIAYLPERYEY